MKNKNNNNNNNNNIGRSETIRTRRRLMRRSEQHRSVGFANDMKRDMESSTAAATAASSMDVVLTAAGCLVRCSPTSTELIKTTWRSTRSSEKGGWSANTRHGSSGSLRDGRVPTRRMGMNLDLQLGEIARREDPAGWRPGKIFTRSPSDR